MSAPLRVVIAGAGIAGGEAALALRELAGDRVQITIVDPRPTFRLRPLLAAEALVVARAPERPLGELAASVGATALRAAVEQVHDGAVTLDDGTRLPFDALLVAVGARRRAPFARASTFGLDDDPDVLAGLAADLEYGYCRSAAFVMPRSTSWPLALYEAALMTADAAYGMGTDPVLSLVTPERSPMSIFGPQASAAVAALLERAGIRFHGDAKPAIDHPQHVRLGDDGTELHADRIMTVPRLEGPGLPGVTCDAAGFVPIDDHARAQGAGSVFAAGDAADYPIKHGGLAAQQATAAAEAIAALAGAAVAPRPMSLVLRGQLLAGRGQRLVIEHETVREEPLRLWHPDAKVDAPRLVAWLTGGPGEATVSAGLERELAEPSTVRVDVPLPDPERRREALALDPYGPL